MAETPTTLPILLHRAQIEEAVRCHQVVIVCGETGSGKTTQLPQWCLELQARTGSAARSTTQPPLIGHTQPRRLAARSVAARIAEERGERLGETVGVQVRFHDQTSRRTRLKVMTDGILLAELSSDPMLLSYGTVILDEAHERSLNIDFLLGYFRKLLPRRPDFRLIITSATIEPQRFSDYFGGPPAAPIIEVSGRTFPVELRYRPTRASEEDFDRVEMEAVADAVEELCSPRTPGDVLVFLPGEREIRQATDVIVRRQPEVLVLPLYSRLSDQQQDAIFHPSGTRRRVILSTNVAETSLTVPGIRHVVDTGLARIRRYDPQRKIERLPIEPISRAAATQRAGRCGRVAAGVCIRLFSEDRFVERPAFTEPELRRTNLAGVILRMKSLGPGFGDIDDFVFLDSPDAAAIADGYETLFELGAISAPSRIGVLTPIGDRMSRMPLDPRIARMLIGAEAEDAVKEVVVLAAALSIQDPRERPMGKQEHADRAQAVFKNEASDFLTLLRLWDQYTHADNNQTRGDLTAWCRDHFLSATRMREWQELVRQLADTTDELCLRSRREPASPDAVHRSLLTGLISNVACREGDGSFDYRGVRGNAMQIFPGSSLFKKGPKWIMAAELVQTTRLYARTVAKIDPAWVEELAGHVFKRDHSDRHLDPVSGVPSVFERVSLSTVVIVPRRAVPLASIDPTAARAVFIREALALMKWKTTLPFMVHNLGVRARALSAEAKLRRHDVIVPESAIVEWFQTRVPEWIVEPEGFTAWLEHAERSAQHTLLLTIDDLVRTDARTALDHAQFPDSIDLLAASATPAATAHALSSSAPEDSESPRARAQCPLSYALSPGKDDDGVTASVTLMQLPLLRADRAAWLVPGMLHQVVMGLLRTLPKAVRATLERRAPLAEVCSACGDTMRFADGLIEQALSETIEVLFDLKIEQADWSVKALPPYLRLRVRVFDDSEREVDAGREVAELLRKLGPRIEKARLSAALAPIERHGITTWDFGTVHTQGDSQPGRFTALVDRGDSVSLSLATTDAEAALLTRRGVRRLFALACKEEVGYSIDAQPNFREVMAQFSQLGTPAELRDSITGLVVERMFMVGQTPVCTKGEFEHRLASAGGKLALITREVCDVVARTLEPRTSIARRLSGGTPRIWADSVADIREHAAFLMPSQFLSLLPWEQLRHYPRYLAAMHARLFSLREEGLRANLDALNKFLPHWKRLTGWVAGAMTAEREALTANNDENDEASRNASASAAPSHKPSQGKNDKPLIAPRRSIPALPQARRAAPTVNVDAGQWAMQPGRLPTAVERYRWALEELRIMMFTPDLVKGNVNEAASISKVERLWSAIAVTANQASARRK